MCACVCEFVLVCVKLVSAWLEEVWYGMWVLAFAPLTPQQIKHKKSRSLPHTYTHTHTKTPISQQMLKQTRNIRSVKPTGLDRLQNKGLGGREHKKGKASVKHYFFSHVVASHQNILFFYNLFHEFRLNQMVCATLVTVS